MSRPKYRSVFKDVINEYIDNRISAGYRERNYTSPLSLFDRFMLDLGKEQISLTKEEGLDWIKQRMDERPSTWYSRVNVVNAFLADAAKRGYDVVPTGNVKIRHGGFIPHIYTEDEIRRYFNEVDRYEVWRQPHFSIIIPVLFRILLGCGTRIEETLSIRVCDVDFDNGLITLHNTKNSKERIVVMDEGLRRIFAIYADKCFYLKNDRSYVFAKANGQKLSSSWIHSIHMEILRRAGIPFRGGGDGPRVHDWRHTFAVLAVKQMTDSGMDMYASLPILSAYLGHESIRATERYVRLTMDRFPYIEQKLSEAFSSLFKETQHEDEDT